MEIKHIVSASFAAVPLALALLAPAGAFAQGGYTSLGPGELGYLFKYRNIHIRSIRDTNVPASSPDLDTAIARAMQALTATPGLAGRFTVSSSDVSPAQAFQPPFFDDAAGSGDILVELIDQPIDNTDWHWAGITFTYVYVPAINDYSLCYTSDPQVQYPTGACDMAGKKAQLGWIRINNQSLAPLLQRVQEVYRDNNAALLGSTFKQDDVLVNLIVHELGHALGMQHEQIAQAGQPPRLLTCPTTFPVGIQEIPSVSVMANGAFCYPMSTSYTPFDVAWINGHYPVARSTPR